jgi:hypothetical protein
MTDPAKDAEPMPSKEALDFTRNYDWPKVISPADVALALDRAHTAGVQEERERCAAWAERYAENPPSGDSNNTLDAFNVGMDHQAGCVDAADCILKVIQSGASP